MELSLWMIKVNTWFGAARLEYPVYMDEGLPRSVKKRVLADFKDSTVKNIQDQVKVCGYFNVIETATGVEFKVAPLAPRIKLEVM